MTEVTIKKTPSNGSYRSVANSQESEVVKEEITYESALREEGIDEVFVARNLKDLLRAQGRRWNPKKGSWEKFEDYGTQLAALREIAKILGLYRKDSEGTDVPVMIHLGKLMPKEVSGEVQTASSPSEHHRLTVVNIVNVVNMLANPCYHESKRTFFGRRGRPSP